MRIPNYAKSEDELDDLPVNWERHPAREKWAVLESPYGRKITYYMSARTYRLERNTGTISGSPGEMYKEMFLDRPDTRVPFGKYEGHFVKSVVQEDPDYADWLCGIAEKDWLREPLEEELNNVQDELHRESQGAGASA